MKLDTKSIVSKYWREFEKLAVQMISTKFNITPDLVCVTRSSKDGGFDAIMSHDMVETEILNIHHTTLLEAKLRSAKKSLGLRAFAATLVIAYNFAAQTLIIVSNRTFSKQALQQSMRFKWKTNMQVKLIDGPTLSGWILRNYKELVEKYPQQLLDFLVQDSTKRATSRLIKITNKDYYDLQPLSLATGNISGSIKLGWISEKDIAPCEIFLDKPREALLDRLYPAHRFRLIGNHRKETAKKLVNTLIANPGIAVLHGSAGVGKSVLVQHVLRELARNEFPIASINLSYVLTSRQLFITLLSALSGVDPTMALNKEVPELDYTHLVSHAGGKPVPPQMRNAVLSVLRESVDKYRQQLDLNEQLLLDFLENVIRPHIIRRRPILVFQELNRTSPETLEFLNAACNRIVKAGVTVLIELRDSGYATIIPSKQWEMFVKLFLNISTLGNFSVGPLTAEEADEFLEELLPGIGPQRSRVIRKRVGHIPLFLYSASVWLREQGVVSGEHGPTLIEDLERFFEGISPENCKMILERLILTWRERIDYPFADCISAAVLLNGRLGSKELSIIAPESDPVTLAETLQNTGLFTANPSNPSELEVLHDLLFERMSVFEEQRPFRKARVAKLLLPRLNELIIDPFTRKLKLTDLLSAIGRWDEVYTNALECGKKLAATRQWGQSSRYLELAHKAAQHFDNNINRAISNIRALVELLDVEVLRYRIGLEKNLNRLDALKNDLKFTSKSYLGKDWQEFCLRTIILDWRAHYVREDFQKALEAAIKARDLALQMPDDVDIELRGKALSNYAVTLKVLDRRQESFDAFDEAVKIFPNSITLKAERLSNIAAFALRDNPDLALQCYQELLREVKGTNYSFLEIIHAHVDLAMANFLRNDYDTSMKDAAYALLLAESNGVPAEEARARNIIGCCYWARNNVKEADKAFDMAAFASERTISHRFLWRMRTNRAGTALDLENKEVAYAHTKSAEILIIEPRRKNFQAIADDNYHITSRWYVALLAIALYYHRLNKVAHLEDLFQKVKLPHFRRHAEQIFLGDYPDEVFAHTTHLHNNRIMITG